LFALASSRGYFDAAMEQSNIVLDLVHHEAQIIMHFNTGIRYKIGETQFSPTKLRESFLRRFLQYQKGDYYHNQVIQNTQQALAKSGYFDQVVVTPLPDKAVNGEIPIDVHLVPKKPRQYLVGVGYGTDTGVRGTLGFKIQQVNSYGHQF